METINHASALNLYDVLYVPELSYNLVSVLEDVE